MKRLCFQYLAIYSNENLPKSIQIVLKLVKNFTQTKQILNILPKVFKYLPKWWNFARFGHTAQTSQPVWPDGYIIIQYLCTQVPPSLNVFWIGISVTRFGKILPLWQKFISIWQIWDCLFLIWKNAEHAVANLWHYWAHFDCCKWPNIEK